MTSALLPPLVAAFCAAYGAPPTRVAMAPGRVNLIGEHTDYNGGFVLPCAIDFHTLVAGRARPDRRLRVLATNYPEVRDEFSLDEPITARADAPWCNYVRGMVKMLLAHGAALCGADLAIAGNVPQGAGLSSSASLEIAVGQCFKSLAGLDALSATDLALIGQRAENQFVGCNCGLMDQLISAHGQAGHALLIDCQSLEMQPVPMPPDLAVLIVHSGVQRGLVDSAYNERRTQCEQAAHHCGVSALRDLNLTQLERRAQGLDATALRRARHVVTENQRTLVAATALAEHDLVSLGQLMLQSHVSMRDDFEITTPAIDRLVAITRQAIGPQGGARMTGGGFGGCVVALMPQAMIAPVRAAINAQYRTPQGELAPVYVCRPSAGAGILD